MFILLRVFQNAPFFFICETYALFESFKVFYIFCNTILLKKYEET